MNRIWRAHRGQAGHPVYDRIAVIGGGAWGTALAIAAARAGRSVTLWCRRAEQAEAIARERRNPDYLADIAIPDAVRATGDLGDAVREADAVLLVTPSRSVREMARALAPLLPAGVPVFLGAKGIERGTGTLMTEVACEALPGTPLGAISGPTFAAETARGDPTAVTVASDFPEGLAPEEAPATRMALSLGSEAFRPYISDDLVGVEVGGAVKNVVAIACGIMTGAGFAENTRAALITRGLVEMKALAEALGGRRETVTGLSGLGDLTLTCTSARSRNMSLGLQLGRGVARGDCFEGRPVVVEGEETTISATERARRLGVEMPICEAVRRVLHEGGEIGETFARLWARPLEAEPRALALEINHPADEAAVRRFADTIAS